jgi:hypothetical protein
LQGRAEESGAARRRRVRMTIPQGQNSVRIGVGSISVLRLFDVAYAIDLDRVESLWAAHARASTRARHSMTPAKAMAFADPQVVLSLPDVAIDFGSGPSDCSVTASFYAFGAVTIKIGVPLRDLEWTELLDLGRAVDRAVGPSSATSLWSDLLANIKSIVLPALLRPSARNLHEDYTLVVINDFGERMTADALLERIDLVPLLSGETRELAASSRRDLLRNRFSYYRDDLAVVTWDRAFIYEPRGDSDVADVLEVANAQLLELRYYDELLDAELPRMYGQVEGARRVVALLAARRFAHLARQLYTLVAEVTELTQKIDNALQVTEDVYLARVYASALNLFRVPAVAGAVDRKLAIVRDTYTALYEEASSRRAELLELAIVVLIVVEIGLALWR